MKKGVSLIVLIVTIIVMAIIAGVAIVKLKNENPITEAHETRFKTELATVREDLERKMQEEMIKGRGDFDIKTYSLNPNEVDMLVEKMPEDLQGYVIIENGEVKLTSEFEDFFPERVSWAEAVGVFVK